MPKKPPDPPERGKDKKITMKFKKDRGKQWSPVPINHVKENGKNNREGEWQLHQDQEISTKDIKTQESFMWTSSTPQEKGPFHKKHEYWLKKLTGKEKTKTTTTTKEIQDAPSSQVKRNATKGIKSKPRTINQQSKEEATRTPMPSSSSTGNLSQQYEQILGSLLEADKSLEIAVRGDHQTEAYNTNQIPWQSQRMAEQFPMGVEQEITIKNGITINHVNKEPPQTMTLEEIMNTDTTNNTEDYKQLDEVQITTTVGALRKNLNLGLKTWATIMLILSTSVVKVNTSAIIEETNVRQELEQPRDQGEKREIFRPLAYDVNKGPLFDITEEPNLIQINKGNFSLYIETYKENPYIRTSMDIETKGYKMITQIIDTKPLSVEAANAIRFLQAHNMKKEYKEQLGFSSTLQPVSVWEKSDQNNPFKNTKEYMRFPHKIGFADCNLVCPMFQASMPKSVQQVKEAAYIFETNGSIWIETEQKATQRSSWTWGHKYDYEITWNNKIIYPTSNENTGKTIDIMDVHLRLKPTCQAYKNGDKIDPNQIGYIYHWYKDDQYHKTQPYRLQVAVNEDLVCEVFVPNSDEGSNHRLDDNECICQRNKLGDTYESNKQEAIKLHNNLKSMFPDEIIEDWRYKTLTSTSVLENVDDKMMPRFSKIDEEKVNELKGKYITEANLTNLKVNSRSGRTLKGKDIGKVLMKSLIRTVLSNPQKLSDLHKAVMYEVSNKNHINIVNTDKLIGSDHESQVPSL